MASPSSGGYLTRVLWPARAWRWSVRSVSWASGRRASERSAPPALMLKRSRPDSLQPEYSPSRKKYAECCSKKQRSQRLLPVMDGDETSFVGAHFENADRLSADPATAASSFAFGPSLTHSTCPRTRAEAIGDFSHWNNGLV